VEKIREKSTKNQENQKNSEKSKNPTKCLLKIPRKNP
jgi:hypothetical protein